MDLVQFILHLDQHLNSMAASLGGWLYLVVFLVVFCETGLVVTPFLPGDSLLFALGAICAIPGTPLSVVVMAGVLLAAAVLGDATNYAIGHKIGPQVFRSESSFLFNKAHLVRTQQFYDRYGGKTVVIARFIPIIRTFAPFLAGVGAMRYARFGAYNVVGAVLWVGSILFAGFFVGQLPLIKKNFHLVIFGIIFVSILPALIEILRERRRGAAA